MILESEREATTTVISSEFEAVRAGFLNHSMQYYDSADGSCRIAADESQPIDTRVGHAIAESGASSMAANYDRSVAALERASLLAELLVDEARRQTRLLNIAWMSHLLTKWKLDKNDKSQVRALMTGFRSLQQRAFEAGDHFLRDLCEQEISELSNPRGRQPKTGSQSKSGAIFQQIGSFLGSVTVLHTRVIQTESTTLARKLMKHVPKMELYGLPTWRLHRTLIDYEPDTAQRQHRFDEFRSSIGKCQFHPAYLNHMMETAERALAHPKCLTRHRANGRPRV